MKNTQFDVDLIIPVNYLHDMCPPGKKFDPERLKNIKHPEMQKGRNRKNLYM